MDYSILLVVTALCAFGLVMVFSASYYYALHNSGCNYDGYYYLKRQGAYMAIAYPLMIILSKVNYRYIKRLSGAALGFSIILLIAVLLFGKELNGGKRWLYIGPVSVQPSEVAKFGLIFYMCAYMSSHRSEMRSFTRGLVPMLGVIGIVCFFIFLQPNMSMAVIVAAIGFILLYLGGIDLKYFGMLAIIGVILFVVLALSADYRVARITSFRNPWTDPKGSGYQLIQSLYAIGSGGLFGMGLGLGRPRSIPLYYSDFIFAAITEEFGLIFAIGVLAVYVLIIMRGLIVAFNARTSFHSLASFGLVVILGLQTMLIVGGNTKLIPLTGVTLPLVCYGGSSLVSTFFSMGVLLGISSMNAEDEARDIERIEMKGF